MTKTVNVALRLPPELKAAAQSLTGASFYEWQRGDDGEEYSVGASPNSTNEAIIYLMQRGLKPTLAIVEAEHKGAKAEYEESKQMMSFLLDNPTVDAASPSSYPEGSIARKAIESWIADNGEGLTDQDVRTAAASEFADSQRKLAGLGAALAALTTAISRPEQRREARRRELADQQAKADRRQQTIQGMLNNTTGNGGFRR